MFERQNIEIIAHMKPFLLSILKCPRCSFPAQLHAIVTRASKTEAPADTSFATSRAGYFTDNGSKNLLAAVRAFHGAEGDFHLIDEAATSHCCADDLNRFLLGNEIETGTLTCSTCSTEYPITDRIVRFLRE